MKENQFAAIYVKAGQTVCLLTLNPIYVFPSLHGSTDGLLGKIYPRFTVRRSASLFYAQETVTTQ